jgi:adenosylcobinamide kinase/adenosylcobinamide-phosphate guanylyltransferase
MIAGGARSGKSGYAESRLAEAGRVAYIATLAPLDAEMRERIARHRAGRSANWETIEAPDDLPGALSGIPSSFDAVLVDCFTGYLSNRLLQEEAARGDAGAEAIDNVLEDAGACCRAARACPAAEVLVVTNEVGSGVVPPSTLGRAFRDLQGWANQRLAAAADEVVLVRFGLPASLKG